MVFLGGISNFTTLSGHSLLKPRQNGYLTTSYIKFVTSYTFEKVGSTPTPKTIAILDKVLQRDLILYRVGHAAGPGQNVDATCLQQLTFFCSVRQLLSGTWLIDRDAKPGFFDDRQNCEISSAQCTPFDHVVCTRLELYYDFMYRISILCFSYLATWLLFLNKPID